MTTLLVISSHLQLRAVTLGELARCAIEVDVR